MAIQKNFVVKNGIEVNNNLIFADTDSNKVGIATTNPRHNFHVIGGIGATNLTISGISTVKDLTINGRISAGSSLGGFGQYLVSTGAGVTWAGGSTVRTVDTKTAGVGATTFNTSYTVGLLDVYINGVKLSGDEFTAVDAATVVLDDACFGGETVEFISYSPFSTGLGGTSIQGITILEEGVPIGSPLQVTSINFIGAAVTAVGAGFGVTVYVDGAGSSNTNYWEQTAAGIHTLSNVGVGTTNAISTLTVKGNTSLETLNVSGVSTFNGSDNYFSGNIICSSYAGPSRVILTGGTGGDTNFYNGGTSYSDFIFTAFQGGSSREIARISKNGVLSLPYADGGLDVVGVSTFVGNVGIGTTNPTSKLTVRGGDISVGVSTAHGVILTSPNGTQYRLIVDDSGTLSTVAV